MTAVSDSDVSQATADGGEVATYPTITVTGEHIYTFDGTPLTGVIIFTPSEVVFIPSLGVTLEGSASANVTAGEIVQPFSIATTDAVTPNFSYTIIPRLETPDGPAASPPPVTGVSVPHTLGVSVDISALW